MQARAHWGVRSFPGGRDLAGDRAPSKLLSPAIPEAASRKIDRRARRSVVTFTRVVEWNIFRHLVINSIDSF